MGFLDDSFSWASPPPPNHQTDILLAMERGRADSLSQQIFILQKKIEILETENKALKSLLKEKNI